MIKRCYIIQSGIKFQAGTYVGGTIIGHANYFSKRVGSGRVG